MLEIGDEGYISTRPPPGGEPKTKPSTNMSASNETPRNQTALLALAEDMADGMNQIGATVGLHHHTEATLRPLILKLAGDPAAPTGSNANKGSRLACKQCVDADFRFVDRVQDSSYLFKELTAGQTISAYVIAANDGGEAPPSPTVTKVVGA